MKITNFTLIFALVLMCYSLRLDSKTKMLGDISQEQIKYNNAIDSAVNDALFMLVQRDDGKNITIDDENAKYVFFNSLCINLGISNNEVNRKKLEQYIPIMIFILNDGYYVYHHAYKENQDIFVKSEKKLFYYKDDKYEYYLRLNDELVIMDKGEKIEGYYEDIGMVYTDSAASDSERFLSLKKQIIIDSIVEDLEKYTSDEYYLNNNSNWHFSIPYEDYEWNRTIEDIGMLTVFAGYPYSNSSLGCYSKFAFGGARIWKKE